VQHGPPLRVHRDPAGDRPTRGPTVLAIGKFDGVHLGHQEILRLAREEATAVGGEVAALTFDPHPARLLAPETAPVLIQTEADKLAAIESEGVDAVVVLRFDRELAARSAADFARGVISADLGASHVFVGSDFRFGHQRLGDVAALEALGREHGFSVTPVPPVVVDGEAVSSTRIRKLVSEGRVAEAARLLGRPFSLTGTVVTGQGRGRTIGIPTANLVPETELSPGRGVYAAWAQHPAGESKAVVNIGKAPTFGERETVIEAHLLDFDGELSGASMRLSFEARLRGEQRFAGVDELVTQIRDDIACGRELLG
jgi:riboflavin kinase/FMN adenylyltransferase